MEYDYVTQRDKVWAVAMMLAIENRSFESNDVRRLIADLDGKTPHDETVNDALRGMEELGFLDKTRVGNQAKWGLDLDDRSLDSSLIL